MRIWKFRSRMLAAALVAIMPLALTPALTATTEGAIHGIVVASENHVPLAGIKVHVGDPSTGVIHVSGTTDIDGKFTVSDLPAATYEIGLEKEGKLFLVQTPVAIAPGQNRNLAVALNEDTDPEEDDDTKATLWQNPLTAALLVTGSAILIGVLLENATKDSANVSPIAAASTK